jgi:hypothetical protein
VVPPSLTLSDVLARGQTLATASPPKRQRAARKESVPKTGFLIERHAGCGRVSWQRCFARLHVQPPRLLEILKEDKVTIVACVELSRCRLNRCLEGEVERPGAFVISTPASSHVLCADKATMSDDWFAAIQSVLTATRPATAEPTGASAAAERKARRDGARHARRDRAALLLQSRFRFNNARLQVAQAQTTTSAT